MVEVTVSIYSSFLLFRVGTPFNESIDTRGHYAVEKENIDVMFVVW
jgi:hypothetical protein